MQINEIYAGGAAVEAEGCRQFQELSIQEEVKSINPAQNVRARPTVCFHVFVDNVGTTKPAFSPLMDRCREHLLLVQSEAARQDLLMPLGAQKLSSLPQDPANMGARDAALAALNGMLEGLAPSRDDLMIIRAQVRPLMSYDLILTRKVHPSLLVRLPLINLNILNAALEAFHFRRPERQPRISPTNLGTQSACLPSHGSLFPSRIFWHGTCNLRSESWR